jgi:hypothetical protein
MGDDSELAEKIERVLRKYGLDPCEESVLDAARLESPAPRHVFAAFARSLAGGETHAPFTLQQYEEALERLVLKGLLCIVTPAEIAEQSARNRLAGIPALRGQGIRSVRQRRFHADRLRRNLGLIRSRRRQMKGGYDGSDVRSEAASKA